MSHIPTEIDITALVADLTDAADQRARATAHDDPNNYLTVVAAVSHADAVRMQSAVSALIAQDAELMRLRQKVQDLENANE